MKDYIVNSYTVNKFYNELNQIIYIIFILIYKDNKELEIPIYVNDMEELFKILKIIFNEYGIHPINWNIGSKVIAG